MIRKSHARKWLELRCHDGYGGKLALSAVAAFSVALAGLPVHVAHAQGEGASSCEGKLGIHRTIKVSTRNGTLVGIDSHGRIGLKPNELVLAFDDGPRVGTTEKILEALAQECVKATFFSLGRSARTAPYLLRRVASEGHTIGSHSQNHPLLTKRDDEGVRAEIRRGVDSVNAALKDSGYEASNFFRYPFLDRSKRTDDIVREMGLVAFHINIDSWDWRQQTSQEMVDLTMRRVRAAGGGVVLFHDIQDKTADGLPEFLRTVKNEGYKIVHVVPGETDFNDREDLIAASQPAKPVQDARLESRRERKARQTAAVHPRKAPHPQQKPGLLALASSEQRLADLPPATVVGSSFVRSVGASSVTRIDGDLPVPAQVAPQAENRAHAAAEGSEGSVPESLEEKKRFRFFRKLFGRGS